MKRSAYHVMLAVPTRGQIQWQTVTALEAARDYSPGLRPIIYQAGNLSVAMTRNRIVKRFLETDCTALAMVDDDIAPPANFLEVLDPLLTDDFAMVSIPHSMPSPSNYAQMMLSVFDDGGAGKLAPRMSFTPGLNECYAIATGCVLVRRDALVELGPNPFRIESDPDAAITSDDFLFCADLRAAGYKVGCWWDGRHVDHFRTVSLGPLLDNFLRK